MNHQIFKDQLGSSIEIPFPPKRIVSLVPSQTELLFDLGLDSEVVGITKFCVHPNNWLPEKKRVGGTKNFWFDVIDQLQPDLIIGNREENYLEGIQRLQLSHPVWMSDILTFEDALAMIKSVSDITGKEAEGRHLISRIESSFKRIAAFKRKRVLYLIWYNPWMSVGNKTFIHAMLEKAGFENVLQKENRYPELTEDNIRELNPEVVLLPSEPFPFREEHAAELRALLPNAEIKMVDGEIFSWYGSRLTKAPDYFNHLRAKDL